ncbi:MAG TPA: hypothetical protein PLY93_12140, partial [Turneriella sp.]|nr:hypothetical protein [Turneriella sp.]
MKKYYSLSILCFFSFCGAPAVKKVAPNLPLPTTIDAAVQSDFRTPKNRARDIYRHPAETLKFFGLKKNMTVVEIWPSAGWYSEIIAPYLKESGHYYAALPVDGAYSQKLLTWLEDHPQVRGSVTLTKFTPPNHTAIATEESVDMVLTFRNVHNWMKSNAEKEAFAAFFRILKPGGVLG